MTTRTQIADPVELRRQFTAAKRTPQLLQVRDLVRTALRQTSEAMDEPGADDNQAELQNLFSALKSLLDEIDGRVNRQSTIDDIERRAAGVPLGGSGDRLWDQQQCEFSITRAIAAAAGIENVDAGRERETSRELSRRSGRTFAGLAVPLAALSLRAKDCPPQLLRSLETRVISTTTPVGGPGGAIIPTTWDFEQWVDVLRPSLAIRQLGARVIDGLVANLNLPRLKQATSYGWFAENSPIPTSDEQFDDVMLRPRHAGAILEISRNMLQQVPNPGIEAITRNDLAQVLARAIDSAAVFGAGDAVTPLGIVSDVNVASVTAGPPTYDDLVDLTSLLATRNALEGALGWLADAKVRGALLKLKDLYGRPYGLDVLFQGYPHVFSNLAAGSGTVTDPIIFMNAQDLVLGMWSELDLLINPYDSAAYSKGNILIRGACTLDIAKRHTESFSYMSATVTTTTTEAAATPPPDRSGRRATA